MAFFDNILNTIGKAVGYTKTPDNQVPAAETPVAPLQSVDTTQPMISTNNGVQPGYVQEVQPTVDTNAPAQVISPTIPTGTPDLFKVEPIVQVPVAAPEPILQTPMTQSIAGEAPVQQELATRTSETIAQAQEAAGNNVEQKVLDDQIQTITQESNDAIDEQNLSATAIAENAAGNLIAPKAVRDYAGNLITDSSKYVFDKLLKPAAGFAEELVTSTVASNRVAKIDATANNNILAGLKDSGIEVKPEVVDQPTEWIKGPFFAAMSLVPGVGGELSANHKKARADDYNRLVVEQARDVMNQADNILNEDAVENAKRAQGLVSDDQYIYNQSQRKKAYDAVLGSKFNGLTADNSKDFFDTITKRDSARADATAVVGSQTEKTIKNIQSWSMDQTDVKAQEITQETMAAKVMPISQAVNAIAVANVGAIGSKKTHDEAIRLAQQVEKSKEEFVTSTYTPAQGVKLIIEDLKSTMDPSEYQDRMTFFSAYQTAIDAVNKNDDEYRIEYAKQLATGISSTDAQKNTEDVLIKKYGITNVKARVDAPLDQILVLTKALPEGDPFLNLMTSGEKSKRIANILTTTNDYGKSLNTQRGGTLFGWYDGIVNGIDNAFNTTIKPIVRAMPFGGNLSPIDTIFGQSAFHYGYIQQQQQATLSKASFQDPGFLERFLYDYENYADDVTIAAGSIAGPELLGTLKGEATLGAISKLSSNNLATSLFANAHRADAVSELLWQVGPINMWYGGAFQSYVPDQYTIGNARADVALSMVFDGLSTIKSLRRLDGVFGLGVDPSSAGGYSLVDTLEYLKSNSHSRQILTDMAGGNIPSPEAISRAQAAYVASTSLLDDLIAQDLKANAGKLSEPTNNLLKQIFYNAEKARILRENDFAKGGQTLSDIYSSDFSINQAHVDNLVKSMTPEQVAYLQGIEGDLKDPKILLPAMMNGNMVKYSGDSLTISIGGLTETFGKPGVIKDTQVNTLTKYGIAQDFDYISNRQLGQAKLLMKRDSSIQRLAGVVPTDSFDAREAKLNPFIDSLFVPSQDGYRWSDDAFQKLELQATVAPSSKVRKTIVDGAKDYEEINQVMKDEIAISSAPGTVKQLVEQNAYGNMFQSLRKTFTSDLFC